jgi:hypothetical protein
LASISTVRSEDRQKMQAQEMEAMKEMEDRQELEEMEEIEEIMIAWGAYEEVKDKTTKKREPVAQHELIASTPALSWDCRMNAT